MEVKAINLFNELIKLYEKTEGFNIFCYSSDRPRDFKVLAEKVEKYKERLNGIIADDEHSDGRKAGVSAGEEDIQD